MSLCYKPLGNCNYRRLNGVVVTAYL